MKKLLTLLFNKFYEFRCRISNFDLKFVNLQYNTLICWFAQTNESSTKHSMFQALINLFMIFYRHRALKTFYFYLCQSIKKNKKINSNNFCKEFCKKLSKKIMLITLDAWSTIRLSQQTSVLYCRLTNFWVVSNHHSWFQFQYWFGHSLP